MLRHGFVFCLISVVSLAAQTPAAQPPAALIAQGGQKLQEGKFEEALALYRQELQRSPNSLQAHAAAGVALDLMGLYGEARQHLEKAIQAAPDAEAKARAMRSMAMSYAFEGDYKGAEKYESQVYASYLDTGDYYMAGEIANELARVCLELGQIDLAEKWYRAGHDAGLRQPDIPPDRLDLWAFRWEHAQARIAARRGNPVEARQHVAKAKEILDRGAIPAQAQFFPYLTGYVAFHANDYKTALAELGKANQTDPYILSLIAQAHEKLGDQAQAMEYYRKVASSTGHNPPAALSIPLARRKLG